MSADNLVCALPFRKSTGAVVWRVAELTLSGLPLELCLMMSTAARVKRFQEFAGADAAQLAHAAARKLERSLDICEYGLSLTDANHPPHTMEQLQREAVEEGYEPQYVYALREASDEDFARMEVAFWANH